MKSPFGFPNSPFGVFIQQKAGTSIKPVLTVFLRQRRGCDLDDSLHATKRQADTLCSPIPALARPLLGQLGQLSTGSCLGPTAGSGGLG